MFKFKEKKPSYTVCKECGVHFEPVTDYEARWGDLCKQHRGPVTERDRNKDLVIQWATENWEKLLPQAKKAELKKTKAMLAAFSQQRDSNGMFGGGAANWKCIRVLKTI